VNSTPIIDQRDLPRLRELGPDLLHLTVWQKISALTLPFVCSALYFVFASFGWWIAAVLTLMYLSFITYGSISHDLVHRSLGLPKQINDLFLSLIELLAIRSGHAYRLVHLHHHARYPAEDDIEGAAARMSFIRTLFEGIIFQTKLWVWAVRRRHQERRWVVIEAMICTLIIALSIALYPTTPVPLLYVVLMVMGSWIIPLITSYIPHTPDGRNALFQTRMFRGRVASVITMEHLYHLEHHLYPAVPHQNWPELARRLDPYLLNAGIQPVKLWF
jgi:beta-carotene hydroxylase